MTYGRVVGLEPRGVTRPGVMALERWLRVTMGMVLVAAAAYLLFRLRFVLVTIALAAMTAYALLPLVEWTARVRVAGRSIPRLGATRGRVEPPRLAEIPGMVPSLRDEIVGCAFAPRCAFATDRCRREAPQFEQKAPDHFAACFESARVSRP
jgi:oligopeptide/dipeptide ABC transporter ATP-binding protein